MRGRSAGVRVVVGAVMVALGVAMALLAGGARIGLLVALVAAGLVLGGLGRLAADRGPAGRLQRGARAALAAGWIGLGLFVLLWPGTTVRTLVVVLAVALAGAGAVNLLGATSGTPGQRVAGVLRGVAALGFAALALLWPVLTVLVVGVLFGSYLVFAGLSVLLAVLAERPGREPATPTRPRPWWRRAGEVTSAVVLLVVAGATFAGTYWLHAGGPQVVPDAFYTPPRQVPGEPGRLIAVEPLDRAVPAGAQAWRILYTTTDGGGSPAVASGTVLAPAVRDGTELPVVTVAHGTTGVVPRCAPSLAADPFANGAGAALAVMVEHGWVGVLPDYVGLGTAGPHAYLVGEDAGRNVLDARRAATQVDGLVLGASTVVWGHSQGGHGALWTGMVAAGYAPELDVLGVAAMAPATDLYELAEGIKDGPAGKIVTAYIATSWDAVFPDAAVADQVTPGYAGVVERIGELCFEGRDAVAAAATASQLFDPVFGAEVLDGALGDLLRANTPTADIPAPVLVAQGDADSLVLASMQRAWVEEQCAAGHPIDYREYAGLDHVPLVEAGSPLTGELVAWTLARLAGEEATPTCGDGV